jgi:hypothetical protein
MNMNGIGIYNNNNQLFHNIINYRILMIMELDLDVLSRSLRLTFLLTSFYGSLKRLWMSIKTHTLKIGLQHCKRGNMSQSTSTEVLVKKLGWVETS